MVENEKDLLKWDIEQSLNHIWKFKEYASTEIGVSGIVLAIIASTASWFSEKSVLIMTIASVYLFSFLVLIGLFVWFLFPKRALKEKSQKDKTKNKSKKVDVEILNIDYLIKYRTKLREKAVNNNAKIFTVMTITFALNMLLGIITVILTATLSS